MRCCWELFHVRAYLGQDAGGGFFLDARNALQQMERFGKCRVRQAPSDLGVEGFYLFIKELKMTKSMPDEKALMVAQAMIGNRSRKLRIFSRAFFLAKSAICSAVIRPSRSAASINLPDTQKTSDNTSPSLMFASSSTF